MFSNKFSIFRVLNLMLDIRFSSSVYYLLKNVCVYKLIFKIGFFEGCLDTSIKFSIKNFKNA